MLPELLTLDDVSRVTRTGKTKLYEEINQGRLKAVKYGRSTRVTRDDLIAWIKALPAYNSEHAGA